MCVEETGDGRREEGRTERRGRGGKGEKGEEARGRENIIHPRKIFCCQKPYVNLPKATAYLVGVSP